MNLSPKKCKEMCISFLAKDLDILQLTINDMHLEKMSVHKVLGVTLCDNLKWCQNTKEIVEKTCKHLYLLGFQFVTIIFYFQCFWDSFAEQND